MRIARLRISNFRGINSADVQFNETTVLIGPNNVGKTTIIEALALVFGREGMVRMLSEHDFFGSDPQPEDRIKIIATVVGFTNNNPDHNQNWFSMRRGVPVYYNPDANIESSEPQAAPYLLACNIGFQARFDRTTLEAETIRFFCNYATDLSDVFIDETVTPISSSLLKEIGLFLIPANRTWDKMLSFGSELFKRVIASNNGLPAESIIAERDRLRNPENPIENHPRLSPLIDEVNSEIRDLFGSESDLHLRLTTTDSLGVLETVVPHFGDDENILIPSKRQGSGLISLQSLFLLLHFGKNRIDSGLGFCLIIEEPELHLPPAIQRRILHRIKSLSSQIIVSTHSPLIAGFSDPTDLFVLNKSAGQLKSLPLLKDRITTATPNTIRTLFQLKRVELVTALMAEVVIVPEGILDYELLSILLKAIELQPGVQNELIPASFGLIPTHDSAVELTTNILSNCHPLVIALVDGDPAGRGYSESLAVNANQVIIRWPENQTIEDIIGWIIGDQWGQISHLLAGLPDVPATLNDLIIRMKSTDRNPPIGFKQDRVAYETIAQAIISNGECVLRCIRLFKGISAVAKGIETEQFVRLNEDNKIYIFQP